MLFRKLLGEDLPLKQSVADSNSILKDATLLKENREEVVKEESDYKMAELILRGTLNRFKSQSSNFRDTTLAAQSMIDAETELEETLHRLIGESIIELVDLMINQHDDIPNRDYRDRMAIELLNHLERLKTEIIERFMEISLGEQSGVRAYDFLEELIKSYKVAAQVDSNEIADINKKYR